MQTHHHSDTDKKKESPHSLAEQNHLHYGKCQGGVCTAVITLIAQLPLCGSILPCFIFQGRWNFPTCCLPVDDHTLHILVPAVNAPV